MSDEPQKKEEPQSPPAAGNATAPVDPLKECEAKRDEYLNGWKRAQADFINYKKDEARRFEEFASFSNQTFIKALLPVLDSFELARASVKGNDSAEKGMMMIRSQLENVLKTQGVQRVSVRPGDELDPAFHEAMLTEEVKDTPELRGKILEELAPGYTLNGRVIRAVKVKIAK